jgi:predicted secreted protein
MGLAWTISIYFITWWTVLFAILPLGMRGASETGAAVPRGCERGAPVNPNLKRKFLTTTWISALLVGALWLAFFFNLIHVPQLPDS